MDRVPRYVRQLGSKYISRLSTDYNDFHNWKLGKSRALSVLGIYWTVFPLCPAYTSVVHRHLLPFKGIFPYSAFINFSGNDAWYYMRPFLRVGHLSPYTVRSVVNRSWSLWLLCWSKGCTEIQSRIARCDFLSLWRHFTRNKAFERGRKQDNNFYPGKPPSWKRLKVYIEGASLVADNCLRELLATVYVQRR